METKKRRRSRIWGWILGSVLFIVAVLAGIAWYLSREWKPLLGQQMKELVLASSDSLYHIEYDSFDINLVTGNASITNFRLLSDTSVYLRMVANQEAPDNLYELRVKSLMLRNFHPKLLYQQKKLNINSIVIDNPSLAITNKRQPYNDTVPVHKGKPKTMYQMISKVFKEVKIGGINLKNIDFTFINRSNQPAKQNSVRNLNINISDILIDSLSETDKSRLYHTRNVDLLMTDYRIATPDSLYYLNFKNMAFSTSGRRLRFDRIDLQPRYKTAEFYRRVGHRKERFNIAFNEVLLKGIDLRRFSRDQKLYATSFNLKNGELSIYNTNDLPKLASKPKYGKFPHQQLQKLALDLKIDTFNLRNINISYSEYNKVSRQTGKVTLDRTYGRIFNLTNDSVVLAKNHHMKAFITTYVMNSGRLDLKLDFDLFDKNGAFTYSGTLGKMDGRSFNKITRPLGLLEINSASIKRMTFSARASEINARGSVQFYYNDLNVNVFKRDKETGEVKKQGLISTVANIFVIHADNPSDKGKFTEGTISYVRPPEAAFFAVIWKSLFTGIKESVGVSAEKETKIKNTVQKVGNLVNGIKQKLEERKERRKERKEERKEKKLLKEKEKNEEKKEKEKVD
ncbi:hypothetical protein [Hufsiella ginkgonis]|uniref:DUF748 domain-containing protein n=1 Tax=Hufsiella ginkgonis TaxID=2695274 RepID=A0A7K1Y2N3_9SPHI|nr:hypothetical protein [Hufsiella ginkgonis]MXV17544.1 hypothetical protein [Hufsiella ginkgonis]